MKVNDKRRFNPDGSVKEEGSEKKEETKVEEAEENTDQAEERPRRGFPEITFESFVISLATSAQVHLGLIPNPATGKQEKNLNLAKQTIDIISMLEKKTEGNLDEGENDILEKILYDLRMIYVQYSKPDN